MIYIKYLLYLLSDFHKKNKNKIYYYLLYLLFDYLNID